MRKYVTICRCNNVKLGTIETAISDGARTIAEVGKATTATTGQCGGSCTPRVLELLSSLAPADHEQSPVPEGEEDAWWTRTDK